MVKDILGNVPEALGGLTSSDKDSASQSNLVKVGIGEKTEVRATAGSEARVVQPKQLASQVLAARDEGEPVDEKVSAIAEKAHAGEAITEEEIKMLVDEADKLESALRGRAKPEESAE